jgi:hypothetical protein
MNVKRILQKFLAQVQSRCFPLIDRNPQRLVEIYHAKPEGFWMATQRVHGSAEHATRITLRVLPAVTKP